MMSMKILRIVILGLLAVTLAAKAQDSSDPWRVQPTVAIQVLTPDTNDTVQAEGQPQPNGSSSNSPGYAESTSVDIQALAAGLQNDPLKIFNYVHDHIRFVLYFGSIKGAELTLLEQSGNDFDQCALLVALLQAAGYTPSYGFGLQKIPYQATDGTVNDLQHWWQLSLTSTNWSSVSSYLNKLVGQRGYSVYYDMGDNSHVAFQRVWVTLTIGGTTYNLDPAFKINQPVAALAGFSLPTGIGSSAVSNDLIAAAAGTDSTNYTKNLNEAAVQNNLTAYTTNLLGYLQNSFPNASVQDVIGGWQVAPATNTVLSQSLIFPTYVNSTFPLQAWWSIPTNFMSALNVAVAGTNQNWFLPQLAGQGVSLSFDGSGLARLWLGNSVVLQSTNTGSGQSTTVTLTAKHPFGGWDSANNVPIDSGWADDSKARPYQRTNANYAIMYGFAPSLRWLNAQQQQLDVCRQSYSNSSPQVINGTLNVMGLTWLVQTELAHELMCQQTGVLPEFHHRIGRMAQEAGSGYYVDVYMQQDQTFPSTGLGTTDYQKSDRVFDVGSYFWSALEHGVIEQMQNTNLVGASTVKMLEIANTNGQAVYLINSTNWSTVSGSLTNYGSTLMSSFASLSSQGWVLLVPQNGANTVAGSGTWKGNGFVEWLQTSTQRAMGMIIGGGYNGGYVSIPSALVNPDYVSVTVENQPTFFDATPLATPTATVADPVDAANGTFQVEHTDLSVGQAEPRGITLSRYYNGMRRFNSVGGLTPGWVHNYCITANSLAAPQAGLGGTTPAQMASMLVASYAALQLYNNTQPNPKNWLTTALIAKWGVDQLAKNGVSVSLGRDAVQFVKQPNGVFTPPANCTMTLLQTNSAYWLQIRHGSTFKFNAAGCLTNIVDKYGQSLGLTYNASNWVQTVSDWQNRATFTFTYTGTPQRLASVSDGTRTVSYGYSTNSNTRGDLTSFTDAEGKTSTYGYDTNHEINTMLDAASRLIVSNNYDGSGHVITQFTQGDTNKIWRVFWSGWQTVSQDPTGASQINFYDDKSRLIGQQDALGNWSQSFYDGQNHVTQTVSPMGETNCFVFDGNHNLTATINALGVTNRYSYDSQNNLIRTVDPLGNTNTFGYNAQFSLISQTNGAGDWVNYAYNSDGTLQSCTDAGGQTTYGYDSWGLLKSVNYPNNLGSITNFNNVFGDVTNHIDGRGLATAFQYNNRRQLTTTIAPSNLTARVNFDAIGNAVSVIDPKGNIISNSWSVTRHLLATIYPAAQQGAPVVTNLYDTRDCLVQTLDPYQQPTVYVSDAATRVIAVTDPLQRTTGIRYDRNGRRIAVTNAAQEVSRQTWDANGNLLQLIDGASHLSARVYDAAGNQIVLTNRNGKVWQFQYDGANRLTNTITPLGHSTSLAFNHQGLVSWMKDFAGQTTTNGYDGKRRLTTRADGVGTTSYGYDLNDNQTNLLENGQTNSLVFDVYNRVTAYRDGAGNLIQYRYDANGNITNLVYPGGKNVYYAFDNLNRLTNVTDWAQRKTVIGYDLAGRVKNITRPNGSCRTIGYDSAGQATNILEQMSNSLPIAIMMHGWTNSGAMAWEFAAPLPHPVTVPTRTMTYDDDNRLLTINGVEVTNDLNANLTYAPLTNGVLITQVFDARNRLVSAGGVTNFYDAINSRIGQTRGTNVTAFVINPNTALPQTLMRIKNGLTNYYIYGAGLLYQITETASATNTLTYHYDYRGSTIALSADNGQVTDRIEYSAYGLTTYRKGSSDTPFLFNGRYGVMTDANGLLYMRARYYNPYLCRFISQDPSGFGGGLNCFAYANGNPVSYLDPFGLGTVHSGEQTYWQQARSPDSYATAELRQAGSSAQYEQTRDLTLGANFDANTPFAREMAIQNAVNLWTAPAGELAAGAVAGGVASLMGRAVESEMLNPNAIRFSQDTIKAGFKDPALGTIDDLAAGLKGGSIEPSSVEPIRLVEREGNLISIDNRRLEAFRRAGVDVPTRMATPAEIEQAVQQGKFSAGELGGSTIRVRGQ